MFGMPRGCEHHESNTSYSLRLFILFINVLLWLEPSISLDLELADMHWHCIFLTFILSGSSYHKPHRQHLPRCAERKMAISTTAEPGSCWCNVLHGCPSRQSEREELPQCPCAGCTHSQLCWRLCLLPSIFKGKCCSWLHLGLHLQSLLLLV